MSSTIGFRPARNLAGGSRYIETQPVGDALRTLGTLNESLPEDTIPPLAGSIDEIDALNLPPVLNWAGARASRASCRRQPIKKPGYEAEETRGVAFCSLRMRSTRLPPGETASPPFARSKPA